MAYYLLILKLFEKRGDLYESVSAALFCHAGGNEALRQGSGASVYCTAKSEPCHRTAGMQFLSYVEKSLEYLVNGIETMAHISRGEGCIELGVLRTLGLSLIPELANGFLQEQRDKHIQF